MKTCVVLALFLMAGVSLGDIQKRIRKGGRDCTPDESKSFVFVTGCSGTVIGNGNWILTAKHCRGNGGTFDVKDVTSTLKVTSKETFPHKTADIMLIKGKTGMEGMDLVSEDDCNKVLKKLIPMNKPVKMVISAKNTETKETTGADVSMCADIDVEGSDIEKEFKEKVLIWTPLACNNCDGDSGAGIIYNKALFAVHTRTVKFDGKNILENSGPIVCNGEIRNWIVNTMKDKA